MATVHPGTHLVLQNYQAGMAWISGLLVSFRQVTKHKTDAPTETAAFTAATFCHRIPGHNGGQHYSGVNRLYPEDKSVVLDTAPERFTTARCSTN
jgi:hypothetical protein